MTLQDAIAQAQNYLANHPGIRSAPPYPPGKIGVFPTSIAYAGDGVWQAGPMGVKTGLHTIVIEIHVGRADLPKDVETVMGYCESVPNLLLDKLLNDNYWGGTLQTFEQIRYTFGPLGWAGISTLGFRFFVEGVKMQSAIP